MYEKNSKTYSTYLPMYTSEKKEVRDKQSNEFFDNMAISSIVIVYFINLYISTANMPHNTTHHLSLVLAFVF